MYVCSHLIFTCLKDFRISCTAMPYITCLLSLHSFQMSLSPVLSLQNTKLCRETWYVCLNIQQNNIALCYEQLARCVVLELVHMITLPVLQPCFCVLPTPVTYWSLSFLPCDMSCVMWHAPCPYWPLSCLPCDTSCVMWHAPCPYWPLSCLPCIRTCTYVIVTWHVALCQLFWQHQPFTFCQQSWGHDSIVLSVCPVMPNLLSLLSPKSVAPPPSGQESCGGRKVGAHAGAGYCREEGRDAARTAEESCKEISEPLKPIAPCKELCSNTHLAYCVAVLYARIYNTHIVICTT